MSTEEPGRLPRLLRAAHAAAARGWPVFPVIPGGKQPPVTDWENHATTDPDTLAAWWETAPYNIGIACGPAGLLVIDLDTAGTQPPPPPWADLGVQHGRDVLAVLAHRAGAPAPTGTYTVTTPRGEHRYFTAPGHHSLGNTAGRLGWRIDTRGDGGYVIAAGSLRRPTDPTRSRPRPNRVANPAPAAPLPDWITAALTPPRPPIAPTVPAGTRHHDAYVQAAVAGEARNVAAAAPGTRNTTLFIAAARLGGLAAAGVLDDTTAAAALRAAAHRHVGIEEFTTAEADRTIANGLRHGRQQPRPLT